MDKSKHKPELTKVEVPGFGTNYLRALTLKQLLEREAVPREIGNLHILLYSWVDAEGNQMYESLDQLNEIHGGLVFYLLNRSNDLNTYGEIIEKNSPSARSSDSP